MASTAPHSCISREPNDEQLLAAALFGDQSSWAKLLKRLDRYLLAAVRRRAPDLPDDLQREVIQELWTGVATRRDGDFDPSAEPARHYVARFLSLGLDRVRAAYRAPGMRSRRRDARRSDEHQGDFVIELVSFDELNEAEQPVDDRIRAERERVEAAIDIRRARTMASPVIQRAIDVMWDEDIPCGVVAAALGINRLTLRRRLLQLGLRLAA